MSSSILAVDFGTSNTLATLVLTSNDGLVPALSLDPAAPDPTVMKSVLYSPRQNEWHFGAAAVSEYIEHGAEGRLFRSLKRFLPDPSFAGTTIHGRFVNLSELIGSFLAVVRAKANSAAGDEVRRAVFGRPAVFATDSEHDALAERRLVAAAKAAGFTDVHFCPEPVAAAYEFRRTLTEPKTVLVADFGGGTSDFTIARLSPGEFQAADVLATHGINAAGDRFDGVLMRHEIAPHLGTGVRYRLPMGKNDLTLPKHFLTRLCTPADITFLGRNDVLGVLRDARRYALDQKDAHGLEQLILVLEDQQGYRLYRAIEAAKVNLSSQAQVDFAFEYPGIDLFTTVDAAAFGLHAAPTVEIIMAALDETLGRAAMKPAQIDLVCMTGGTAQLPALKQALVQRFGSQRMREHHHFHSVVGGLAERAKELL